MDLQSLLLSTMNALGTMIIVVMFVTGPLSLAVELATRTISRR